jgi:hypothetical protein
MQLGQRMHMATAARQRVHADTLLELHVQEGLCLLELTACLAEATPASAPACCWARMLLPSCLLLLLLLLLRCYCRDMTAAGI